MCSLWEAESSDWTVFYGWYLNKRFWLRLTHGTIPPYPTGFYLKQQRFSGWILQFLLLNLVFIDLNLTFNQFHSCFYVLLRNNIYIYFFSLCVFIFLSYLTERFFNLIKMGFIHLLLLYSTIYATLWYGICLVAFII